MSAPMPSPTIRLRALRWATMRLWKMNKHDQRRRKKTNVEQFEHRNGVERVLHGGKGVAPDDRHRKQQDFPEQRRASTGTAGGAARAQVLASNRAIGHHFDIRWQRIGPWNILALNLGVVSARVWLRAASWSNKNGAHRTPGTPRYCSNNQAAHAIQPAKVPT